MHKTRNPIRGTAPSWKNGSKRPLERVYYLCAPRGLMDIVENHLAAMGVPEDRVRRERW